MIFRHLHHDLRAVLRLPGLMPVLAACFLLRLFAAAFIPLGNDEAYYWDWGRALQLSYFDHPPGVSWLAAGASAIFRWPWAGMLAARGLVPLMHFASTVILGACLLQLCRHCPLKPVASTALIVLTQAIPVFSLGGMMLLPDAGLIFSVSLLLYLLLCLVSEDDQMLKISTGLGIGLAAGLAGLFKYHAAPICGGMLAGFFFLRRTSWRQDFGFWLGVGSAGLAAIAPVILWNLHHDFASFAFQGARGFTDLRLNFVTAGQVLIGQLIMLTPGFAFYLVHYGTLTGWSAAKENKGHGILLAGFLPLFLLMFLISLFKPALPHWVMPGLWILIPGVAMEFHRFDRWFKFNTSLTLALSILIPVILGFPELRARVNEALDHRPGALGELTVWDALIADGRFDRMRQQVAEAATQDPSFCPKPFLWASLRWYSTAQLAFHLPQQPKVYSLESNERYYYATRDDLRPLTGCTVLVVAEQGHFERERLAQRLTMRIEETLTLPDHLDRPFVLILGVLRP